MLALFAATAALAATPSPSPSPGNGKPKVAVLAHAPDVAGVDVLSERVATALLGRGYPVLSRSATLGFLAGGGEATPPDPLEAERAKVADAEQKYLNLDLDAADAQLHAVEDEATPLLADPLAVPLLRLAFERRALVLLTLGRVDAAAEKLEALYVLDPEYKPEPRLLAPQFAPAFDKARRVVEGAHRGVVTVSSVPAGADVYLDGRFAGASPATVDTRSGRHVLQVRFDGYVPAGSWISVDPDRETAMPVTLAPADAATARKLLLRAIAADVLPGGHDRVAAEVRAATGADAVAFVLARPTADGALVSAEVYGRDPDLPPSKSTELGIGSASNDKGSELASQIAELLAHPQHFGPAIAAPFATPKPPIPHPYAIEIRGGGVAYYGTGWKTIRGPNNLDQKATQLCADGSWRVQERYQAAIDLVATISGWVSTAKAFPDPPQSHLQHSLGINAFTIDVGPRLEIMPVPHGLLFFEAALGGENTSITYDTSVTSAFAFEGHVGSGIGWSGKHARVTVGAHIGAATIPFPRLSPASTLPASLNVGGYGVLLGFGWRL